jgi:Zn-dependent peptidase ImmA (M78 family)
MNARAKVRAREILDKYCIKDPSDFDIRAIANAENLMIKEEDTKGHIGRIYIEGDAGIITIDRKIKEEGRKKFTIAHEVGHFSLEKEREYFCSKADIMNFWQHKNHEQESNIFAAELLMPEEWIKQFVKWKGEALETLEEAAVMFGTTLSSMSLRYAECGKFPIAVIFSQDGRVKWSKISEDFPLQWVEYGQKVNEFSKAYEFYEGKEMGKETGDILADAWFLKDRNYKREKYLYEQNVAMKRLNAVLTFVWDD